MKTLFAQSLHRTTPWTTLVCLLMLVTIVAACGQGSLPTQSSSSQPKTPPSSSPSRTGTPVSNTPVQVKVKEVRGSNGGKNQYSFSPSTVRGNVGDIITFVNQSDAAHALISTPAGWITSGSILDVNETQAIELLKPGSFTISSQEHPEAKLSASVGGSSNDVLPPQAVVLSEKQGAKASYSFSPIDIGVDLGYGALIVNQTAETQILMITPAQGAVEGSIIDKNETQLMQFTQEYNYIVSSKAHPEAKVMICVD